MGRAFADRNYRLFFAGQGVSLVGTWMTRLATGWLVFRLGGADAPWLLGVVSFAGLAPAFFLGPLGGVLVDRWDRHTTSSRRRWRGWRSPPGRAPAPSGWSPP
jgi:hypothetical protein